MQDGSHADRNLGQKLVRVRKHQLILLEFARVAAEANDIDRLPGKVFVQAV